MALAGVPASSYSQQNKKTPEPVAPTRTNEWPQFRGPNGSGVAEGFSLPSEFNSTKNLVWKTSVPFARSSPVVTANHVFLTASEGDKLITLALDRKTGKLLWRRDVARARHMPIYKANDAASPSPVSDGKNVFAFFGELGLISYGPDGTERWRVPLGPFNSFYGMGGSPVLAGNTLVMVCDHRTDSFIIAIDARNGKELWRKSRANFEAYSTPSIYTPKDGPAQVIVLGSQTVDAYSLANGKRLWWVNKIGSYPKGVPVVGTDMVYVMAEGAEQPFFPPYEESLKQFDSNKDQRLHREEMKSNADAYEHFGWVDANNDGYVDRAEYDFVRNSTTLGHGLTAVRLAGQGDLTSSNVVWSLKKAYPNIPAPLLYRGVMYLMKEGGIVSSLDPANGQILKQGRTPDALEEYYASPVAADGKIFLVSASGKVTVLKADPQWEILATNDLGEEVWATPAIAGSNLYIRTRNALYSFGAQSNDEINDRNWQNNSKIIAIRKIVNSAEANVRNGTFKTEHRICEEGWFSRLRIARDAKGTVRWYQHYQEGEDSSWDDNYYYDDAGKLRFVLMTSYAINGTREQHRAYFDESGHLLYHGRRLLKGPGYFGPPVEDLKELVQMDPKKDFAEATQGCKEVKSSAKHRART
jgi:outer membrane protein assembly factor BamB